MTTITAAPTSLLQPFTASSLHSPPDWRGFDPSSYLNEYYADLGGENRAILQFYVDVFRQLPHRRILLDVGSGPTIYSLISAVTKVDEIHIGDYLEANRMELRKWLRGDNLAFNWRPFIEYTIQLEHEGRCSAFDIIRREAAIRNRVTYVARCDLRQIPAFVGGREAYDIVTSNFCAESITDDLEEWRSFVANVASLLKAKGTFIMTTLKRASYYSVGPTLFPAVSIDEGDVTGLLRDLGFSSDSIVIRSVPADRPGRHYQGLMLVAAIK